MTANQKLIYNYRRPILEAMARVFDLASAETARVWTPYRDPEFKKARPRFEIAMNTGAALGFLKPVPGRRVASGHLPEKARVASGDIRVITAPEVALHDEYLTLAEFILDTLAFEANQVEAAEGGAVLQHHSIGMIKPTGGSGSYSAENGHYETIITYEMNFSVKESSWALIGL